MDLKILIQVVLYKTLNSKSADVSSFLCNFEPDFKYDDNIDLSANDCKQQFLQYVERLQNNITQDMCNNLEIGTRGQDLNKNWIEARKVLITASNMGLVCNRTKSEPD